MLNVLKNTELAVIRKRELALDRNIKEILKNKESLGMEDLLKRCHDFELKRGDKLRTIQKVVKHFCEIMTTKKKFSQNIQDKSDEDLLGFKEDMITLKSLIDQQKKIFANEILNLQRKAEDLNAELGYFYEKLPNWKEHKSSVESSLVVTTSVAKNKAKQKFQEINNFFDFVHASGGKEGGWRKEDHFLFLKFLMKYKQVDVVAKSINEMLPDITEEEVHDHFQWFVQYQTLLKAKKDVILNWKEEKNNSKKPTKSDTEENHERAIDKGKGRLKTSRNSLEERLKNWKKQKELELQRQKELEKQKLKEKREKEEKRKQKQEEIKNMVNQWKSIRQTIEENHKKEKENLKVEENKNRSRTAKKLIKQFQSMDELRIKKMRELKLKKEKIEEPKRTKSGPLERINSQRNPKRLLKPTQQWMNRVHDSSEDPTYEKPAAETRTVLKMPKLHIPEWRKTIQ